MSILNTQRRWSSVPERIVIKYQSEASNKKTQQSNGKVSKREGDTSLPPLANQIHALEWDSPVIRYCNYKI